MNPPPDFHRHASDYLSRDEWDTRLSVDARVARVLGTEPIPDARHLLAPLSNTALIPAPAAETTSADFVLRLIPGTPRSVSELAPVFPTPFLVQIDFPRVVAQVPSASGSEYRDVALFDAPENARVRAVELRWSLPDLLSIDSETDAIEDLRRFLHTTTQWGTQQGLTVSALSDPTEAVRRTRTLRALLSKLSGHNALRLAASGSFGSRAVWRSLYSLGLEWGNMDLFHWFGGRPTPQFRVLSSGSPAYFLPERAAEGERVPGLILEYDLPRSTDPVGVFDRMAIALSYLRDTLGGHPLTPSGWELDGERLDEERDALENAVTALTKAGIAPGSETALRFF